MSDHSNKGIGVSYDYIDDLGAGKLTPEQAERFMKVLTDTKILLGDRHDNESDEVIPGSRIRPMTVRDEEHLARGRDSAGRIKGARVDQMIMDDIGEQVAIVDNSVGIHKTHDNEGDEITITASIRVAKVRKPDFIPVSFKIGDVDDEDA